MSPPLDTAGTGRRIAAVAATAALVAIAVAILVASGGSRPTHALSVVVDEATNVVAGQYVRAGGTKVGEITRLEPVDGGRAARIDMRIDDDAWPLPTGSRMTLRWGGTVNYSNRYVDLVRGPAGGAPMATDGRLPAASFTTPVEFDGLLRAFDAPLRRDVRGLLQTGGRTLRVTKPALRRALDESPRAVQQAALVLRDLDAERYSLRTLVRASDDVLGAVQRARPGLKTLLGGAAGTFDAIAAQSASLQDALQRAPGMLTTTRATLARADETLDLASTVTRRLAPGVSQLRRVAAPLNDTLRTVRRVGPDAERTLASVRDATPDVNPLLDQVRHLSPQLESIGRQAVDNLKCIRPYAPSIASFFSNWGDYFSLDDGRDKLIRAQVQNFLPAATNANVHNSGQAAKLFPGLKYGFPRPPGTNAGQPWFLPECGAGRDALDPAKDPEARPLGEVFKLPPLRSSVFGGSGR